MLKFNLSIGIRKKVDLHNFECGMVVCASVYGEWSEKENISSVWQFFVDARGHRRTAKLLSADRKATVNNTQLVKLKYTETLL